MCKLLHFARFYTLLGLFSPYKIAVILNALTQVLHKKSQTAYIANKHTHKTFSTTIKALCSLSIELIIAHGGLYKLLAAFISIISYPSSFPQTFFRRSFGLVSLTHARAHTHTHAQLEIPCCHLEIVSTILHMNCSCVNGSGEAYQGQTGNQ